MPGQERVIELERRGDDLALGTRAIFQIPRSYYYKNLKIYSTFQFTSGANPPVYAEDAPFRTLWRMILRIQNEDRTNVSGRMLGHHNQLTHKVNEPFFATAPAAPGVIHQVRNIHTWEFGDLLSIIPEQTYVPSWMLRKFELELQTPPTLDEVAAAVGLVFNAVTYRVFATVVEVSDSEKVHLQKTRTTVRKLFEDEEVCAGGFAAFHQYRTQNLNRGFATSRLFLLSTAAGVRTQLSLNSTKITQKDKDIRAETPIEFDQFQTVDRLAYQPPPGITLIDLDMEGDHLGLPLTNEFDEFSLRYTANALANAQVNVGQEELVPGGYSK